MQAKVEIINVAPNLQEQMLIQDQVDASLVFNVTSYLNILGQNMDPDEDFKWFPYGEAGLDIYSNGVMVSPKLLNDHPDAVKGLVSAIAKAMADVIANPAGRHRHHRQDRAAFQWRSLNMKRMEFALNNLIYSDETKANGIGAQSTRKD